MHSSGFFQIKPIARLILKCKISGSHMISDQSLLLSTTILNDINIYIYTVQLISNLMLASARKTTARHRRSKTREYRTIVSRVVSDCT